MYAVKQMVSTKLYIHIFQKNGAQKHSTRFFFDLVSSFSHYLNQGKAVGKIKKKSTFLSFEIFYVTESFLVA